MRRHPTESAPDATILLVEDDGDLRRALCALLDSADIGCHAVDCAERALDAWAARTFDALVTDLRLPRMDGVELIAELTRSELVPAIVITGFRREFDPRLHGLGVCGILEKPLDWALLLRCIRRSIEESDGSSAVALRAASCEDDRAHGGARNDRHHDR